MIPSMEYESGMEVDDNPEMDRACKKECCWRMTDGFRVLIKKKLATSQEDDGRLTQEGEKWLSKQEDDVSYRPQVACWLALSPPCLGRSPWCGTCTSSAVVYRSWPREGRRAPSRSGTLPTSWRRDYSSSSLKIK